MSMYWTMATGAIGTTVRWRWLTKKLRTPLVYRVLRATLLKLAMEPMMVYAMEMGRAKKLVTDTMNETLTSAASIPDMRMSVFFLWKTEAMEA